MLATAGLLLGERVPALDKQTKWSFHSYFCKVLPQGGEGEGIGALQDHQQIHEAGVEGTGVQQDCETMP